MAHPWTILIALAVLCFALLIKHVFSERIEEGKGFLWLVGAFFVTYIIAAGTLSYFNPTKEALAARPNAQSMAASKLWTKFEEMQKKTFHPFFLK